MSARIKLSKINADRLAAGLPMKMLRGRCGWHLPETPPPPLRDIHPVLYRDEDTEARRVVADVKPYWFGQFLIHIPNQGGAGAAGRARSKIMKSQGQMPGVSDYLLAVPVDSAAGGSGWPGLWIELKSSTGKPSDDQVKFSLRMQGAGYAACFAYTADGAAKAISTYLSGRWPR